MASEVDICNIALAHLGDEAQVTSIRPPDGSVQSKHCGRFYPIARDQLLEAHAWTFATRRVVLSSYAATVAPWEFAYALPSKCLRALAVLPPTQCDGGDFIIEIDASGTKVLYTNVEQATLRYIQAIEDTTRFTPGFAGALGRLLASYLAGPILKGVTGMKVAEEHLKLFAIEAASAKASDANAEKRKNYRDFVPSAVKARGSDAGWRWGHR